MKKWALLAGLLSTLLAFASGASPEGMTAVSASPPVAISSVIIPPTSERSIVFGDRGKTFIIGVTSGRVIVIDGSAPAPYVPPQPPSPVTPSLTGLAKSVYDSVMALPIDAQNRKQGAIALTSAIDSAISEAGGLGVTDPQALVNMLASNAEANQVGVLLKGFKLGDILSGANVTTKDQLVKAMEDIKAGLKEIK